MNNAVGGILAANLISMLPVGAQEASQYGLGDAYISVNEEQAFLNQYGVSIDDSIFEGADGSASLPSSIDLSTSPYFPVIGNQGSI